MFRSVDPRTAHQMMQDGYVYIDVRTVDEFEQGHPAGAYNIPAFVAGPGGMQPNPRFLDVVKRHFEPSTSLVLGCAAGGRSARACQTLAMAGYQDLVNVEGGYLGARDSFGRLSTRGWKDEALPTSTDAEDRSWAALAAEA